MKIERKQLQEIEFLFKQSVQGLHLLFDDNKRLTDILSTPTAENYLFDSKNKNKTQKLFTDLVSKKSFKAKRAFLNNLNSENFEILVRTYFHILDNTILNQHRMFH